ncbi:MAG: type IX secretion system membrane protein PorP/SprF [Ferruginibacter sp.]
MKFRIIISLLAICAVSKTQAQQQFTFSQFMQHNFIFNPAAAGANDQASIGGTYRKMWSGIDGGPQTAFFYGDMYFDKKNTGLAVVLYDDKTGPTARTGGQINLSYSMQLDAKGRKLMMGFGANVLQYRINKAAIADDIPNDPLLGASANTIKGDAAAGIYYKSPTFNIGFSVQNIIQTKFNYIKTTANPEGRLYRHYYIMSSYNLKTDDENTLIPNALVQFQPGLPADISAGVKLDHKDLLWIGFNYHRSQGYTAYLGVKIDHKLAIGYAYDQYSTPISLFDDGSGGHEISLRYFFGKK